MKNSSWLAGVAIGVVMAVGCASGPQAIRMRTSLAIPAAQGTVKASSGKNGNTSLVIDVRHLAPPERVAAGATTYVVWAQPLGEGSPQNLGALRVDEDLRGTLATVTPLRSFDLFITAEASATQMEPTNDQLFSASIPASGR